MFAHVLHGCRFAQSSRQHHATLLNAKLNVALDLGFVVLRDHRSHHGCFVARVTNLNTLDRMNEFLKKIVVN